MGVVFVECDCADRYPISPPDPLREHFACGHDFGRAIQFQTLELNTIGRIIRRLRDSQGEFRKHFDYVQFSAISDPANYNELQLILESEAVNEWRLEIEELLLVESGEVVWPYASTQFWRQEWKRHVGHCGDEPSISSVLTAALLVCDVSERTENPLCFWL